MKTLFLIIAFTVLCVSGYSDTLYVPGDYPTIMQAINAADDGDIIFVAPGTYVENVDFLDKAVKLVGEDGPNTTVIDGNQNGTTVAIRYVTGGVPMLYGFKITNGLAMSGAGISCQSCDPAIGDCIITLNTTTGSGNPGQAGHGAGILIASSSPSIEDCTFSENEAGDSTNFRDGNCGGGIYADSASHPEISNCNFLNNKAGRGGDGDYVTPTQPGDGGKGGAIYCTSATIRSCFFMHNYGNKGGWAGKMGTDAGKGGDGGAVYCDDADLENCFFISNLGGEGGDGQIFVTSPGDGGQGGGVFMSGPGSVINCTFVNNETGVMGSGIGTHNNGGGICAPGAQASLVNSILWNDIPDPIWGLSGQAVYCCFSSGSSSSWFDPDNCIIADPAFFNPAGNNYHLSSASPCVNRGTELNAPEEDAEGDARPYMSMVDMGADEFTGLHPLEIDTFTLSASQGGDIDFNLYAGPAYAHRTYAVFGSVSGTIPGVDLPCGLVMPLEWDGITDLVMEYWNNTFFLDFLGTLDASGEMTPVLHIPNMQPIWVGAKLYFSYTLYNPFDFVGNAIAIEIVM